MLRVHYARSRECKCRCKYSPRASTIVRAHRTLLEPVRNSFVRVHNRVSVYSRVYVCAPMRFRDLTSSSCEARRKMMKRDSLRRLEIERCSRSRRSRMRFFARARSRGLSRSQPVFVIIMLEKCMNICFINASSYFISFYNKKRKVKQNFPILANSLVIFIFIHIYIAPIIAHSL